MKPDEQQLEIFRLRKQRDELAEALRAIEALNMSGIQMSARVTHCSAIARAALAKLEQS